MKYIVRGVGLTLGLAALIFTATLSLAPAIICVLLVVAALMGKLN